METALKFIEMGDPQGAPLALLHGWGCDSRFLYPIAKMFPHRHILLFDLPGYGVNKDLDFMAGDVEASAEAFHLALPPKTDVIAWSMGAHFAICAASLPRTKVRTLVTVCSSARFPADPTWPGMDHTLILKCYHLLTPRRCGRLLRLFAKYQIAANLNDHHEQEFMNELLHDEYIPDFQVLKSGIDIMSYSDVREPLRHLHIPCLFLFGAKDILVPPALAYNNPSLEFGILSEAFTFPDSAHVPFLTEPDLFKAKLDDFYDRVNTFFKINS